MNPTLYWISPIPNGRLAIAPRPRSGDWLLDELTGWKDAGVQRVVSLLTPAEQTELELVTEGAICTELGMHYRNYPIPDYQIPHSRPNTITLLQQIQADLMAGQAVLVHCRGGIGRSGLITSSVLVAQGLAPQVAMATVSQARGIPVPETEAQQHWVTQLPKYL